MFPVEVAVGGIEGSHVDRSRWQARPVLAHALSLTVFILPLAVSFFVTRLLAPLVSGFSLLGRVAALGLIAVAVGLVAERILRRFLPLAALLRMTMLFPDRAPSRFKLARAAGGTGVLEERARMRPGETAGEAATRILGLLTSLSAHDRRTRGHSERVRVFTDVLAAELHLDQEARDHLRWAALLHDLGKIDVPATVLNKPAELDANEWVQIRRHPDRGAALAGPLLEWLGEWGAAIPQHHERFDGKGYPRGLAGHEIALAGRVVAVADVFEVMTAARTYKRPMSVRAARRELAQVAGTQLDPACVRAFLGASIPRVLWTVGPLALLVNLPFLRGIAEVGRVVEQAGATAASQAATAAVAATTAVVVIATPGVNPAAAADVTPAARSTQHTSASADSTSASASTKGRTAATVAPGGSGPVAHASSTASGSATTIAASGSPTGSRASADPTTSTSSSTRETSSPTSPTSTTAASDPVASTTPSASSSPTPSATSSTSSSGNGGNSGSGGKGKPGAPVIVSLSVPLPVLHLPVIVIFTDTASGVTFECRIDGGEWSACTSPASFSGLSRGDHRVEVKAINAAGKESPVARRNFTV